MAEGWEDFYKMLGVDPEVSQEEIKHAYRELVKRLHPDKLLDRSEMARDWAEERLKKINQAYQVLNDPQQRKEYDVQWSEQQKKEKVGAIPPQPVVEPATIRFQDVKPGQIQTASFVIKNAGGPYTKIWFSNPDSWVRVARFESVRPDQELPLRVEIEAEGWDWDHTYNEQIKVRLTNEETGVSNETQVAIRLQTKPEPVRERYVGPIYTTRARPAYTPPPPSPTPKPKPRAKPRPKPKPKPRSKLKPIVIAGAIAGLLIGLLWVSGVVGFDEPWERSVPEEALALDENGYLHICYDRDSLPYNIYADNDLKYAYQDSAGWHIEIVERGSHDGWVGVARPCLSLDKNGYPHIVYEYADFRGVNYLPLKYAYRDSSGWHIETVDEEGDPFSPSLALDQDGRPHISYRSYRDTKQKVMDNVYTHVREYALKYAHKDSSGWHIETVNKGEGVAKDFSLALDQDGHPHISCYSSYFNYPSYEGVTVAKYAYAAIEYAYQDSSGWQVETVNREDDAWGLSLALDENGHPHISYISHFDGDNNLKYAYQDSSGWHVETVDNQVRGQASLVLGRGGYPHISYFGTALKYAYRDPSGWHVETVGSGDNVGGCPSLILDENGHPYIHYYDSTDKNLKYAYRDSSGWHTRTVTH